jgi:hypothetical protein
MAVERKALSLYDLARSAATFVLNLQARSLFFSILAAKMTRAGIRAFPFLTNLYVTVISFTHHPRKNFVLFIASSSDHRTIWNFTA